METIGRDPPSQAMSEIMANAEAGERSERGYVSGVQGWRLCRLFTRLHAYDPASTAEGFCRVCVRVCAGALNFGVCDVVLYCWNHVAPSEHFARSCGLR